jgi:acyl carrier protein
MHVDVIRDIIHKEGRLPLSIGDTDDLFAAGLDSIAMVNVMMAIEERLGLEFPDDRLNRHSFSSIAAIKRVVEDIQGARVV